LGDEHNKTGAEASFGTRVVRNTNYRPSADPAEAGSTGAGTTREHEGITRHLVATAKSLPDDTSGLDRTIRATRLRTLLEKRRNAEIAQLTSSAPSRPRS
jgi:hypothetical protein